MENEKRRIALFGIGGLISLFLVIGVSYAVWQLVLQQTGENVVTTGCFKINFTEKNDIHLNNAYPIIDAEGRKLVPYEFTLENTCDTPASYQVNLEILDSTTLMNHKYIKVMFDEKSPRILTKYNEVEKTLDNATTSYKLDMGFLEGNTSKTFTLRIWMDEDTPAAEDAMNKIFKSKVTITTVYEEKMPGTLRYVSSNDSNGMWKYRSNITKLVIQDKLEEIPNAIRKSLEDYSFSTMSYVVPNEDGETYTAYLQGNKMIYLNPNSSYLFNGFTKLETIEGMEYLDTSKVTNMKFMFYGCSSLTNLDLSHFETTNVTNMSWMFDGCSSLTSLDLSNFNTSNVTDMRAMFQGCSSLTSLDLSPLKTESVTDMSAMFNNCHSLTSLDLSPLDTTNVTNMSWMFYDCSSLTSLDLSPLKTENVTDMRAMFNNCHSLTSLDLSGFDTSNVINMGSMFHDCSSLTSLDLSNFNTQNVISYYDAYIGGMFGGCTNLTTITYGEDFVYEDGATTTHMYFNCPANKPTHESWNGVFS